MADFLDEKRREIATRLKELEPLVSEYDRLRSALDALDGVGGAGGSARAARGAAAPRPARRAATNGAARQSGRGRPRGTGTRSKEALALVRSQPGISIPEIAQTMGIKQNYLYRVLPQLQKDGLVRKEGRGWHANDAA
jgi:CRP-like cAMP-binding protein